MNFSENTRPVIFGEIVHDCFEDGETRLGGAPFNVAWNLYQFGLKPILISAVGDDDLGTQQLKTLTDNGIDTSAMQKISQSKSGRVDVTHHNGEPQYNIIDNVAFDKIQPDNNVQINENTILYHGSLAVRHEASMYALSNLLLKKPKRFIDINLRDPWWDQQKAIELMQYADYVKLSIDELNSLASQNLHERYPSSNNELNIELAQTFKQECEIVNLLITMGADGAAYLNPEGECIMVPAPVRNNDVVDTVGAGDAFASVIVLALLQGWDIQSSLTRAQVFASYIVGQRGATCEDTAVYQDFMALWGLAG